MMKKLIIIAAIIILGSCTNKNRDRGGLNPGYFENNNTVQLSLSPSGNIEVGDNVSLNVFLNNVQDVFACSFEMVYDMEIMRVDSVVFDDSFGDTLQVASYLSDNLSSSFIIGLVNNGDVSGLSGSWSLADVYFTATSSSSTSLEITNFLLFDNEGNTINYYQEDEPALEINIDP